MKIIISIALSFQLLFSFSGMGQTFAHFNSSEIILLMPENKIIHDKLTLYQNQFQEELRQLVEDVSNKEYQYSQVDDEKSIKLKSLMRQEIEEKKELIKNYETTSEKHLAQLEKELMDPLKDKVQTAAKQVATKQGIDYLYDRNSECFLTYPEGANLDEAIKKELGIE